MITFIEFHLNWTMLSKKVARKGWRVGGGLVHIYFDTVTKCSFNTPIDAGNVKGINILHFTYGDNVRPGNKAQISGKTLCGTRKHNQKISNGKPGQLYQRDRVIINKINLDY